MQSAINELSLLHYRNLNNFNISIDSSTILIIGDNGAGKTNILESISMLSPGRGLRGAKFDEIHNHDASSWHVDAKLQTHLGPSQISTSYLLEAGKRSVEFNGSKITNSDLTKLLKIIWLTPQMEGLFLGSSSGRRKFLDRMVYCFYPDHASTMNKYDYFLRERLKILQFPSIDYSWLRIVEEKLSVEASHIIERRQSALDILSNALLNLISPFPKARLNINGNELSNIELLQDNFKKFRERDRYNKRSNFGPHRSDLAVYYNNIPAHKRSTGEQKAMLISITIAQILAIQKLSDSSPILLLDEIFVHLDEIRRDYLADFFKNCNAQIWITSIENDFKKYFENSQVINLHKTI